MDLIITGPAGPLTGELSVPGDKSISHRSLLLASIATGESEIVGLSPAGSCQATVRCLRRLGVEMRRLSPTSIAVVGKGLFGLVEPSQILDAGDSGTTMRLLCGILAGQPFCSVLSGGASLCRRPMERIVGPLRQMGATVLGRQQGSLPPLTVMGGPLAGLDHVLPVASAQVKSALLLAGLYARGTTSVREPAPSRDHTERMLAQMGAGITVADHQIRITGGQQLRPVRFSIPGDLSSAAYWCIAATIVPGSRLSVRRVGSNPTRSGLVEVLQDMGAELEMEPLPDSGSEPMANLHIRSSALQATRLAGAVVPRLIDELPVLAVAATQARGVTTVLDAGELRAKESDRIRAITTELRKMGAEITETEVGFVVHGPSRLRGVRCQSWGDHRIAMSLAIAALIAEGETEIADADCIDASYPGFVSTLRGLLGNECVHTPPKGKSGHRADWPSNQP